MRLVIECLWAMSGKVEIRIRFFRLVGHQRNRNNMGLKQVQLFRDGFRSFLVTIKLSSNEEGTF